MVQAFISYIRCSTIRQGVSGLGLEAQQEAVRRHVAGVGGMLIAEHVEVESGKSGDRPILQQAIDECRRRKAVLILAKLDRLARNVAFVSRLMESGVEFLAVDAPFANKLMIHILAAFAEHEREQISARTKAALAAAKARGVVLGSCGRTLADRQIADATTFAEGMRSQVEAMLDRGCVRLQDVADALNDAGCVTREGSKWSPTGVQRVLRRLNLQTPAMAPASPEKMAA